MIIFALVVRIRRSIQLGFASLNRTSILHFMRNLAPFALITIHYLCIIWLFNLSLPLSLVIAWARACSLCIGHSSAWSRQHRWRMSPTTTPLSLGPDPSSSASSSSSSFSFSSTLSLPSWATSSTKSKYVHLFFWQIACLFPIKSNHAMNHGLFFNWLVNDLWSLNTCSILIN